MCERGKGGVSIEDDSLGLGYSLSLDAHDGGIVGGGGRGVAPWGGRVVGGVGIIGRQREFTLYGKSPDLDAACIGNGSAQLVNE